MSMLGKAVLCMINLLLDCSAIHPGLDVMHSTHGAIGVLDLQYIWRWAALVMLHALENPHCLQLLSVPAQKLTFPVGSPWHAEAANQEHVCMDIVFSMHNVTPEEERSDKAR